MRKIRAPVIHEKIEEHPVIQALSSEVPILSAITTYWVESVRSEREKILYKFLTDTAESLNELWKTTEELVDSKHLTSSEFEGTVATISEISIRDNDDAKYDYLRNFITNYAKFKRPDMSLKKIYLYLVSNLSGTHILILHRVASMQESYQDADLHLLFDDLDKPEIPSVNSMATDLSLPLDLVHALCATLLSQGLVDVREASERASDRSDRIIATSLGKKFIKFVS